MNRLIHNLFGNNMGKAKSRRRLPRARLYLENLEVRAVPATTWTWRGDISNFNWNVDGNWKNESTGQFSGIPSGSGDILRFAAGADNFLSTNDFEPGREFHSIIIESSGYLIAGAMVKLGNSDGINATYESSNSSINLEVHFQDNNAKVHVDKVGAMLQLNGAVHGTRLEKTGPGALDLQGACDYNGPTFVTNGRLKTIGNDRLPDSTDVTVAPGAKLYVDGWDRIDALNGGGIVEMGVGKRLFVGHNGDSMAFSGIFTGNGTAGGLSKEGIGTLALSGGPHHFPDGLGIDAGTVRLDAANIIGNSNLVNVIGRFELNGFNETIGSLLGSGTVDLGSGAFATLSVGAGTFSGTIAGTIGGNPHGGLWKVGGGELHLTGAVNTFLVHVEQGILALDAANIIHDLTFVSLVAPAELRINAHDRIGFLSGSGQVEVAAGARLWAGGNNSNGEFDGVFKGNLSKEGSGTMTLRGGPFNFGDGPNGTGLGIDNGTIKLAAPNLINNGNLVTSYATGTFDLNGFSETVGSLGGQGTVNLGTATLTVGGSALSTSFDGAITGTGGLTKVGGNSLTLNGNNPFTGTTRVVDGTLVLGGTGPDYTVIIGPIVIGDSTGAAGSAELKFNRHRAIYFDAPIVVNSDGLLNANNFDAYVGNLTINAGSVSIGTGSLGILDLAMTGGAIASDPAGSLSLDGTSITTFPAAVPATISGKLHLSTFMAPGARTLHVADGTVAEDLVITATISAEAGIDLSKAGPGTMTLTGNNTFGGSTTLNAGTLLVNGSISSSPMTVNGGSVGGTGTLGPVNMSGGLLAPGTSPGRLNVGNVTMNAASTFRVELNGTTAGTNYDQLTVTGDVNLGGSTLNCSLGFSPALGTSFTIIDNDEDDNVTGTFSGLPEGAFFSVNGQSMRITYFGGPGGNDVVLTRQDGQAPGIIVTPTSGLTTTEAGGTATFTVVLNSTPTANVTITLNSSDATEGTVSPTTLTFTPGNALTPQTVTITGVDDQTADGNAGYQIITSPASSSDAAYQGLNPADVSVTNTDNEGGAAIVVTPAAGLATSEAGGTAAFTVVLSTVPTGNVTITLSVSDTTEGTVSPTTLTFTPGNALTPQTVTIMGVDDQAVDGNVGYQIITNPATSSDAAYQGLNAADVSVTNNDNDTNTGTTVSFQLASSSGSEAIKKVKLPLVLSAPVATKVFVSFTISGGSATIGTDFKFATVPVKLKPGLTTKPIKLKIINDLVQESDETIEISLTSATGVNLGAQSTHTYTILNNDSAPFSRRSSAAEASEPILFFQDHDLSAPYSNSDGTMVRSAEAKLVSRVMAAWEIARGRSLANQWVNAHFSMQECSDLQLCDIFCKACDGAFDDEINLF